MWNFVTNKKNAITSSQNLYVYIVILFHTNVCITYILTSAANHELEARLTASNFVVADRAARTRTSRRASAQLQRWNSAANSSGSRPAIIVATHPDSLFARARPRAAASAPRPSDAGALAPTQAQTPRDPPSTT